MTAALMLWGIGMIVGLMTSEGEPVCEGPFITSVDDSDPPECPNVWQGAVEVGSRLLVLAVVLGGAGFAVSLLDRRDAASGG